MSIIAWNLKGLVLHLGNIVPCPPGKGGGAAFSMLLDGLAIWIQAKSPGTIVRGEGKGGVRT